MSRPVVAYHIIFGTYSFWLPNDPRASMSSYVFASRLHRGTIGPLILVPARRAVACPREFFHARRRLMIALAAHAPSVGASSWLVGGPGCLQPGSTRGISKSVDDRDPHSIY
jgi:hypothetical protein